MKKILFRMMVITAIILLSFVLLLGIIFSIYIVRTVDREVDESLFEVIDGNTSSKIYYYETEQKKIDDLATELVSQELYGGFRNKPVKYEDIPKDVIYAFVSIEDKRFFEHNGVDWKRTAGAVLNYFFDFRDNFGGSTITQQLIKNVTENDEYSFERKAQEIFWALDLETKMSKEEILNKYLNVINLSNGCYGIGAAAEYYFSKSVGELTLCECASLAAITNNPSYYDPIRNPENNSSRRRLILTQMLDQGYISNEEFEEAYNSELVINIANEDRFGVNLWYVDMVINDVINDLMEQKGYSRYTASMMIYTGGLKIYTAMNVQMQDIVEKYYKNNNNFLWKDDVGPQSSIIIIDPDSGDILAVAGAVGEKSSNRLQNYATETVRPAGSVIKPLSVYAPALEKGIISYSTVYDDVPVNFGEYNLDAQKGSIVDPIAWPKNANGVYRGLTNINYAVQHSINTVTVKVLEDLGVDESFDFLKNKLNINSLIERAEIAGGKIISDKDYAALALGQFNYGVTLRETTAAYSIFANRGVYNYSRSYYKVTDGYGNIVLEKEYKGRAVISEETAVVMTEMLENVVKNGTGKEITLKNKVECAGKTGTTQNNYDKWFIGYTPYLIGGVWYGHEYPKTLESESSKVCQEIWDDIMSKIHAQCGYTLEKKTFNTSDNVIEAEYCVDSGKLVTDACKKDPRGERTEVGVFVKGTEPRDLCDRHVLVAYDADEGGVATPECQRDNLKYVGMILVERSFPIEIFVTDAQYVWKDIGNAIPETDPRLPFFYNALPEGEYCGKSYGEQQYNRYCRAHFNYWKWLEGQKAVE